MELLDTIVNASVVAALGVVPGRMVHGLRGKLKDPRLELHGLHGETKEDIRELRRETAQMRSDLTAVALAVGAKPRASGEA